MKKILLTLLLISGDCLATTPDFKQIFPDSSACFLLYDVNQHKFISEYNEARCDTRITPDSTFKVALSLMAFDKGIINEDSVFKWDGKKRDFAAWNQDQTPQSWLKYSVVWVSQQITPKLGMPVIQSYLNKFNYGNEDFSGDAGLHNGLTRAWLNSSLKISANEELTFLQKLVAEKLPVSQNAQIMTQKNMYLETSASGWQLYGKTGSDYAQQVIGDTVYSEDGWFVGFTKKGKQTYIFVANMSDVTSHKPAVLAGTRLQQIVKPILTSCGVL